MPTSSFVANGEPPFFVHECVNGDVPPDTVASMAPLAPPLHVALLDVRDVTMAAGFVIVSGLLVDHVARQPLASRTASVYEPTPTSANERDATNELPPSIEYSNGDWPPVGALIVSVVVVCAVVLASGRCQRTLDAVGVFCIHPAKQLIVPAEI